MEEDYREWAWLPKGLLHSILDKLRRTEEVIRFGAVCREWHYVAAWNFRSRSSQVNIPLMMSRTKGRIGELHSVMEKKKYKFRLRLPENIIKCYDSSLGWLIMIDSGKAIALFNPFSGKIITFPALHHDKVRGSYGLSENIEKGVLSADPAAHPHDYVLIVFYNSRLAFFKSGDRDWTYIIDYELHDIIYWKSQIYAIDWNGNLVSFEFINTNTNNHHYVTINTTTDFIVKVVAVLSKTSSSTSISFMDAVWNRESEVERECHYLVCIAAMFLAESCEGDLLCVIKIETNDDGNLFWVYEIADKNGNVGWVKRDDLGDSALFVGSNTSVSVSVSDFPGCQCEPNSIYFLDKKDEAEAVLERPSNYIVPFDMGVYNFKHHSISRDYQLSTSERLMYSTPIWILPTPIWIKFTSPHT